MNEKNKILFKEIRKNLSRLSFEELSYLNIFLTEAIHNRIIEIKKLGEKFNENKK